MSAQAKIYLASVYVIGIATTIFALANWSVSEPVRFACYLLIALLASGLKVSLPGINGSMSVNFFFIILGVMELSLVETLIIGCGATLVQSFWKTHSRPKTVQVTFNLANMSTAIVSASLGYHLVDRVTGHSVPLMLVAAACIYFVTNT